MRRDDVLGDEEAWKGHGEREIYTYVVSVECGFGMLLFKRGVEVTHSDQLDSVYHCLTRSQMSHLLSPTFA